MNCASNIHARTITAGDICAYCDLPDDARALMREGMRRGEFVEALLSVKKYVAAIDFVAHALPPREGVWWACLCLQHAFGPSLSPTDWTACRAAVHWVIQPCEPNRAAARAPSEAAGPASAAGTLANAVWLTGSNVAPPRTPSTPPPLFAPAKAVATAVKLSSIRCEPARIADTQRLFVELGAGVAEGRFQLPVLVDEMPFRS